MTSVKTVLFSSSLVVVALLACDAGIAAAATPPAADVGGNVQTWLTGLGQDVLIPTAGLFGIAALFRRDVGQALLVALIAIIVGIFVYDAAGAKTVITSVAGQLTK